MTKINGRWPINLPEHRQKFHEEHPDWESARLDSMHKNIRPGNVLVDVGAEEGDLSALFGTWDAKVIPIECQPKYWPSIKACFELNNLTPLRTFVGFAANALYLNPSSLDFDNSYKNGWPMVAYGEIAPDFGFRNLKEQAISTPRITLDALNQKIDIITIDAEGSELQILWGAIDVIKRHKPIIYASVHPASMKNDWDQTPEELFAYLERYGYSRRHLATDHEEHFAFWDESRRQLI